MSTQLPAIITRYFAAKNAGDSAAVAACFAPGGIVHDEGEDLRGAEAIAAWAQKTSDKYADQTEVLSFTTQGDEVIVTGRVSGTFDGSPVDLEFHFGLGPDGIASLQIQ